jgi:hypothetical protein
MMLGVRDLDDPKLGCVPGVQLFSALPDNGHLDELTPEVCAPIMEAAAIVRRVGDGNPSVFEESSE